MPSITAWYLQYLQRRVVPSMGHIAAHGFRRPCLGKHVAAVQACLQVTAEGGAEQVIKSKRWRDVGDAFKLPKTITSVSFVLRRGYMQYLWDYEQVYFHNKGGQMRIPAPASRHAKDSGGGVRKGKGGSSGGGKAEGAAGASGAAAAASMVSDVDTAAAIAIAALKSKCVLRCFTACPLHLRLQIISYCNKLA